MAVKDGKEHMTICRDGKPEDWLYIDSLRKKEGSALGFIPKDSYLSILERKRLGDRERFRTQRILIVEDNTDLTGFAYISFAQSVARIFQIVVQEDARRWKRAMLMIDEIEADARRFSKQAITCRVAVDLESNYFWRAIGYQPIRQVTATWLNQKESQSKRPLWLYRKEMDSLFASVLPTPEIVQTPIFE